MDRLRTDDGKKPKLDEWQGHLEQHFDKLASIRKGTNFPVFALEHGLDVSELDCIFKELRARSGARLHLSPHWLLWVIYATEIGYGYAGDEYWYSFDKDTPGWDFTQRNLIKNWFKKFQEKYSGVTPSGPWAEHFSIIAWPITHAILPKYLQKQFAKVLYDLRYNLISLSTLEPKSLGQLLTANAYYTSKRFQEFLQQEELVGRIVLALLDEKIEAQNDLIYSLTLKRLISSLEETRNAQQWLRETKRIASYHFVDTGSGSGKLVRRNGLDVALIPKETPSLRVQPSLFLQYTGNGTWSVLLEVPSLRGLASVGDDLHKFLSNTRCQINGATDMKPAGWLLTGAKSSTLKRWPDSSQPLILLETPHPRLTAFLKNECVLSRGPVWLFRVGKDGRAREVQTGNLRLNCSYIILTQADMLPSCDEINLKECMVNCEGIGAYHIDMPAICTEGTLSWLKSFGLSILRTVKIWPAGLPSRGWDGDGHSQWLTTDAPRFGLSHDYPIESYTISLDNHWETTLANDASNSVVFFQLPPLLPGQYSLKVRANPLHSVGSVERLKAVEGEIELSVRDPEPWVPGVTMHHGLIFISDPCDPDLSVFWENIAKFSIVGPEKHTVSLSVSLLNAEGDSILSEVIAKNIELPISYERWGQLFSKFLKDKNIAWSHIEASNGILAIDAGSIGQYQLQFEQNLQPLRWAVRSNKGNVILRLIDDTGQEYSLEACSYDMSTPLKSQKLEQKSIVNGFKVPPPGGLFIAQKEENLDAIIVSTGLSSEGLKGLALAPELKEAFDRAIPLAEILRLGSLWANTKVWGALAKNRQQQIVVQLLDEIYSQLYSPYWMKREKYFLSHPEAMGFREDLKRAVVKHDCEFADDLLSNYNRMNIEGNIERGKRWFYRIAEKHKICNDQKLCEVALRLSSQPFNTPSFYGSEFYTFMNNIQTKGWLLRGARLVALLSYVQAPEISAPPLPRWPW
jgi:hypothetical protein